MDPCSSTNLLGAKNPSSEEANIYIESTPLMRKTHDAALSRIEEQENGISHLKLQANVHLILAVGLGAMFVYEIYQGRVLGPASCLAAYVMGHCVGVHSGITKSFIYNPPDLIALRKSSDGKHNRL